MEWKYILKHKRENYIIEVTRRGLYGIGDTIIIGAEEFIVENRYEL